MPAAPAPVPHPSETTVGHYGRLTLDARTYQALAVVTVRITGRQAGDTAATVRVCDPDQRPYHEATVTLTANQGELQFTAGGKLGTHYVYLLWPGDKGHRRYLNFCLEATTGVATGDADFDELYPTTRDALRLGRREYETPAGKFVGYISADTWHFDGIWLRDWIYGLPAYRYWETAMQCGLDRFLEQQSAAGMIPDGIERDGRTWRVGLESDVEYITVLGVWQTWQATGDDRWMAAALPRLERALAYITSDAKHWDPTHRLIKRQHSCDTWDFDIDGASDHGNQRHVIATCDQSGYALAFRAMGELYRHLGQEEPAARWHAEAAAYAARANELLWQGRMFLHHHHLDAIDHGDFDEREQLAMGNTWAMTRGLATPDQARSIIAEYQRRHAATGDAYPWWSLQPGYPDHLGYFKQTYCHQGGYANGGLMPWVGGELCRAALLFGREAYGVALLRAYAAHLRTYGGAQVWYWPDGTPGFRTTNEVPYAGWGMAEWLQALLGGLAGLTDVQGQWRTVAVTPRWAATPVTTAQVTVRYAASDAYFAYRLQLSTAPAELRLTYTGSGSVAQIAILLPPAWRSASARTADGQRVTVTRRTEDASRYACLTLPIAGVQTVVLSPAAG